MKTLFMMIGLVTLVWGSAFAADTGLSPSSFKGKIYEIWVSPNEDCSDPINVFKNDNPEWTDMVLEQTIGSGPVPDGTYKCLINVIYSEFKYTPATTSTSGNCVAGQEYSLNLCRAGALGGVFPDGTTYSCDDNLPKKMVGYLSLWGAPQSAVHDVGHPPQAAGDGKGVLLSAPLVVNADVTTTYYQVVEGTIVDDGANCWINPGEVGFR